MDLSDIRTLNDLELGGKNVFCRVDFSISKGKDHDITRIEVLKKDLEEILERGGKLILVTHIGRNPNESAGWLVGDLEKIMERRVNFVDDCIGTKVKKAVDGLKEGEILLLENIRKYEEEIKNEKDFSRKLVKSMDIGVFDGFPVSHRKHASVVGVMEFIPFCAGPRFIEEMKKLEEFGEEDLVCFLGGIKKEKIAAVKILLVRGLKIMPGGGVLNAIYKAMGKNIGDSQIGKDEDFVGEIKKILKSDLKKRILVPDKVVIAERNNLENKKTIEIDEGVEEGWLIVDFELSQNMKEELKKAKKILVAGPQSLYTQGFCNSIEEVANFLKEKDSILMGADTIEAYKKFNLQNIIKITGGGAGLEFFIKGTNPALEALKKNKEKFK